MLKLITEMKQKKVGALIIDLRENGGALTEAVDLSGLFITDGPIVQVRDVYQRIRVHEDTETEQVYSGLFISNDRSFQCFCIRNFCSYARLQSRNCTVKYFW